MVEATPEAPLTPTPAESWVGAVPVAGTDLRLPSGNVARVRRVSPQAFVNGGFIPDPLTNIVTKAIQSKKGLPPEKVQEMAGDRESIQASLEMFDRVLSYVCVMPHVQMPPRCRECDKYYNVDDRHKDNTRDDFHVYQESPREPSVLYTDMVDLKDKIFIFQWAIGGTRDLETFRQELPKGLGDLLDVQDAQHQA